MAEHIIDEATVVAWVDGELEPAQAALVARAMTADPILRDLADRHRVLRDRFRGAFGPLASENVRAAPVVSLDAVRAARAPRRWVPAALAASLVAGVLLGQLVPHRAAIGDGYDALALSDGIGRALDRQLSGDPGTIRVALSFRDHQGRYCRSFAATELAGIACRDDAGWRLRYGGTASSAGDGYRMAAGDGDRMAAVETMIAGEPLDRERESRARAGGWRRDPSRTPSSGS